jgi:hypothetical protein
MNKYYKYKGLKLLTDRFNKKSYVYDNIHICAYDVNNDGKYPFQRFLLINTEQNKILKLPTVKLSNKFNKKILDTDVKTNTYTDEFINFVKVSLFDLFQLYIDNFAEFNSGLAFNGFYEYENNLYLFFDVTNCNIKINEIYRANNLWFVTIEEIINIKYYCDIPVAEIVTDFFIQNKFFCFLLDQNNNNYEIPMIGYVGKFENKVQFTFMFGETRYDGMFGPYYYFTNFYSAFKQAGIPQISKTDYITDLSLIDEDGYYIKGGIVRFAIFTGVTKYIENNSLDPIDNSLIKQQRLQDKRLEQNFERLTMRISDYDGKWTENHDSVILGKIELDNGSYISDINIVVKEYIQQIPLSYHYIDKNTLNGKIEDYLII